MRCGEYELMDAVASGATGTVFRARHVTSGEQVAVKQLSDAVRRAPEVLDRLRSEAAALASLDDPHVVGLRDADLTADPPWLAMEWVDGVTLDRLLEHHGALAAQQAVGVLRGAVQGLAHAHDRGVVHRDVAPRNVMLDEHGTSMLVDFGLAAPRDDAGVVGTPAFLSPEAARGEPVGPPGDVYSAGALLHLLLTGRPPFPSADVEQVLRAHREQAPPPLTGHGEGFADLVARCLAKDAAARPPDGRALLRELDEQAERRFGAGWLSGASVAAAVSAVRGGAGASGAVPSASTESVSLTTGSAATGTAPATATAATGAAARRAVGGRRALGLAAAGLVLAGGATGAALLLTGGDDDPAPQPSARPVSEERQVAASASGRYRVETTVVETTFPDGSVGATTSAEWTVTLDCTTPTDCEGSIGSDDGDQYGLTFDGGALEVSGSGVSEEPCVYEDGTQEPDSLARISVTVSMSVPDFDGLAVGDTRTGSGSRTLEAQPLRNCEQPHAYDETTEIRLTRLS
ncbi:MAG TPA: serine/threonine-protein kinase [Mycobacteriales bacterium]|nr:serine/threonine-protein kinase [Mycobacteriales bacterium]